MKEGGETPPRDKATSLSLCISEHTVAARRLQSHQIPHETTRAAASAWNRANSTRIHDSREVNPTKRIKNITHAKFKRKKNKLYFA